MNKKLATIAVIAMALSLSTNTAFSAPQKSTLPAKAPEMHKPLDKECGQRKANWDKLTPAQKEEKKAEMKARHEKKSAEFDSKLGLTEAQKAQSKEIRLKGHEQMKPVMEKMKAKRGEIQKIKESNLSETEKEKKIRAIRAEMKPLKEKADTLRQANMKEFEAILTPEQKVKLEEMKKNGPRSEDCGCKKTK